MAEQDNGNISFRGLLEFISRILDRVEAKIDGHIVGQGMRNVELKSDITRVQGALEDLRRELDEFKDRRNEWSRGMEDRCKALDECINRLKAASGKNVAWRWGLIVAILTLALAILIKGFEVIVELAPKLIGR